MASVAGPARSVIGSAGFWKSWLEPKNCQNSILMICAVQLAGLPEQLYRDASSSWSTFDDSPVVKAMLSVTFATLCRITWPYMPTWFGGVITVPQSVPLSVAWVGDRYTSLGSCAYSSLAVGACFGLMVDWSAGLSSESSCCSCALLCAGMMFVFCDSSFEP